MPIASIKASLANRGEAFAQIGVIRKGGAKVVKTSQSGQQYETVGHDLDHFRFVFDENETAAAKIITDLYGEFPNNIRIRLPFPDVWKVWEFWLEAYVAGAMIARVGEHPEIKDGEEYVCYHLDPKTGEKKVINWRSTETGEPVKYTGYPVHKYTSKKGEQLVYPKPVGRLSVIIPEFRRLVYMIVNTTSWNDCNNITRQLHALDTVQRMRGQTIAGVPLILRRRLDDVSTPGEGGRARRKKWLISIEVDPTWVDLSMRQLEASAVPMLMQINQLPSQLPAPADGGPDLAALKRYDDEDTDGSHDDLSDVPSDTEQPAAMGAKSELDKYIPRPVTQSSLQTEPPKAASSGPLTRPIAPAKLKDFIGKKADQHAQANRTANTKQRSLACSQLEACFAGDMDSDLKRKAVQVYLFNADSFTKVNDAQVLALLDWLKPDKDTGGHYSPDGMAAREAALVVKERARELGQQELFGEAA